VKTTPGSPQGPWKCEEIKDQTEGRFNPFRLELSFRSSSFETEFSSMQDWLGQIKQVSILNKTKRLVIL
jgi:hypothetical protein